MPQAGIHGLVSTTVSKLVPKKELLMLGVIFGNIFPDADNLAVAVATITGASTDGLHRTFTHSLIVIAALVVIFYLLGVVLSKPKLANFGLGMGIGMSMHVFLDLLIWFNGVELLWPFGGWFNFWEGFVQAEWWKDIMATTEFLFFGLFFIWLQNTARKQQTDTAFSPKLKGHIYFQFLLFVIFTIMVYTMRSAFMIPFGAFYLIALGIAIYLIFKMKDTIEGTTSA